MWSAASDAQMGLCYKTVKHNEMEEIHTNSVMCAKYLPCLKLWDLHDLWGEEVFCSESLRVDSQAKRSLDIYTAFQLFLSHWISKGTWNFRETTFCLMLSKVYLHHPSLRISRRLTTSQTLGPSPVSNLPAAEHREPNNALLIPAQENLKEIFKLKDGTQESPSANMRTHEPIS